MIDQAEFWKQAVREGLPWFRFLRRPVRPEQLDQVFIGTRLEAEWLHLKSQIQLGDELWPFQFNVRPVLGMRKGYVLLRQRKPVDGILTIVS